MLTRPLPDIRTLIQGGLSMFSIMDLLSQDDQVTHPTGEVYYFSRSVTETPAGFTVDCDVLLNRNTVDLSTFTYNPLLYRRAVKP